MKNKKVLKKEKRKYLSEYQNHLLRESNLFKNLKYRGVSVAIIALFSFSLYINTFNADYALDDLMLITKNKFTLQGINGIKDILTNDMSVGYFGRQINMSGVHYRPVPQIIFALQNEFFGLNPMAGHVTNAIFYSVCCILLFLVFRRVLISTMNDSFTISFISFLATVFFASHPIHTEVVANIKSLDEIIAMTGALWSLLFCLKYYYSKKTIHLFLSGIFFLLGIFSKENALTFIAVIPMTFFVFKKPGRSDYFLIMLPVLLCTLLFFLIRSALVDEAAKIPYREEFLVNPFLNSGFIARLPTVIYSWGLYFKLLVLPVHLTSDYFPFAIPLKSWFDWEVIVSLLTISGFILIAVKVWKKHRVPLFGLLAFFITFSMTSNLFFFAGSPLSERFMFMPSFGIALCIVYAVFSLNTYLSGNERLRLFLTSGIFIIVIIGFTYRTIVRNSDWKNEFKLFTTDVAISGNSSKANVNAAYVLINEALKPGNENKKEKFIDLAEKYALKAISILPENFQAHYQLGRIYMIKGDSEKANYYYGLYNNFINAK